MSDTRQTAAAPEPLISIQSAADSLGIHRWKLRRAVKAGLVPCYTLFNSRRFVRVSEVIAVIEASREGGTND
jgi:hypothetical protein